MPTPTGPRSAVATAAQPTVATAAQPTVATAAQPTVATATQPTVAPPAPPTPAPRWWWRLRGPFLDQVIAGVVSGVVSGALISVGLYSIHMINIPPDPAILTDLIQREQIAAMTLDFQQRRERLVQLYSPNAVVVDAGCRTQASSTVWKGWDQIIERYKGLPSFHSLEHINSVFTWIPDDRRADRAMASSETIGIITTSDSRKKSQPINGQERWGFEKIGDRWVVKSFTYNVCTS